MVRLLLYENMKLNVNEAVKPWINHLSENKKENNELNNINVSYMLEKMKTNSQNLLNNYGNKSHGQYFDSNGNYYDWDDDTYLQGSISFDDIFDESDLC